MTIVDQLVLPDDKAGPRSQMICSSVQDAFFFCQSASCKYIQFINLVRIPIIYISPCTHAIIFYY